MSNKLAPTETITPGQLSLADLREFWHRPTSLMLAETSIPAIKSSATVVQDIIDQGTTVYGLNTGFGRLANERINDADLEQLQINLLRSHACGSGPLLRDDIVRLSLLLKINSLAQGYSGVSTELINALLALHNHQVYPCIPSKGSVGASGDLAPLAHLSLALIGEGEVHYQGQRLAAAQVLADLELKPLQLSAKAGLALINGLQISTAQALDSLFASERIWQAAIIAGAMSVEASAASVVPFDARIHALRNLPEQQQAAAALRDLLQHSEIRASHAQCERVQDPYSLRCQPQVMGACLAHMNFAAKTFVAEANAVSDNPLVFAEQSEILSGGNFHGQALAMAADTLAVAIAEIGALSERRIALLMDQSLSGLPPFLVKESGLNSGFMIAHVTAAALASENKSLAHPASVDSIPTSANQEDHVSMANFATRRLQTIAENSATIVAIELIAASQGLDLRAPLKTSPALETIKQQLRQHVPYYDHDRAHAGDIEIIKKLILSGTIFAKIEPPTALNIN